MLEGSEEEGTQKLMTEEAKRLARKELAKKIWANPKGTLHEDNPEVIEMME